jgi:hypothetical protein
MIRPIGQPSKIQERSTPWWAVCLGFALACACVDGAALAQVDELPPEPVDRVAAERPRANVDNPEVYLNDSFEASDALAKAQVFVTRGRWTEAAQVLQRAIDGAGDKLVRVASGVYFAHAVEQTLNEECVDVIVRGEGETTFVRVLRQSTTAKPGVRFPGWRFEGQTASWF